MVSPNGRNSREKSYLYFSLFILFTERRLYELFKSVMFYKETV